MRAPLRERLARAGLWLALIGVPCGAVAGTASDEQCTREDAQSAAVVAPAGGGDAAVPQATGAIAAETAHMLPVVTVEAKPLPVPQRHSFLPALFVDHLDLANRLRAIRRLRLFSVFDNSRLTVFFGVDRHGVAGLHVQQQDPNDLPPLLARRAPLADPPPLRAVPLSP